MSEPKISLRDLKEWASDPRAFPPGHARQVLALVGAVEAARHARELLGSELSLMLDAPDAMHDAHDLLAAALARFSFDTGEGT